MVTRTKQFLLALLLLVQTLPLSMKHQATLNSNLGAGYDIFKGNPES